MCGIAHCKIHSVNTPRFEVDLRSHSFLIEGAVAERFATRQQNFAAVSSLKGE